MRRKMELRTASKSFDAKEEMTFDFVNGKFAARPRMATKGGTEAGSTTEPRMEHFLRP